MDEFCEFLQKRTLILSFGKTRRIWIGHVIRGRLRPLFRTGKDSGFQKRCCVIRKRLASVNVLIVFGGPPYGLQLGEIVPKLLGLYLYLIIQLGDPLADDLGNVGVEASYR